MAIDTKKISVGILVTVIIIIIIYFILLFEWYKTKSFIFAPYTRPSPPESQYPFYPTGKITPFDTTSPDYEARQNFYQ